MNNRTKSVIIGAILGAVAGAIFGAMAAESDDPGVARGSTGFAALTTGDFFKVGISVLALARELGAMTRRA